MLKLLKLVTCLFSVFLFGVFAAAKEKNNDNIDNGQTIEEILIEKNKSISANFDDWADTLDVFLAGKRISSRPNRTRVTVQNSIFSIEGQKVRNSVNLGVQLRLPNLEESWALKFMTYDDSEEDRGLQKKYLRDTPRERNYGASLQFFKKLGNVKTTFQPRVELTNPLKISHYLAFKSSADYGKYEISPKLEFFARPDKGTGIFGALNFTFLLGDFVSLAFLNETQYEDLLGKLSVDHGLSLSHKLNDRSSLNYAFITNSNNRPRYHLESYNLSTSFSHVIYRNILDFQIIPYLSFPKIHGFKGLAGLTLHFTLMF